MIKTPLLTIEGKSAGEISLPENIFGQKENAGLLHQSVVRTLSNQRTGTAHSKTRAEVSGGGKKPWRQKGTGNARAGSSRSPLWIGGGVTFGPRSSKNWTKRLPKKMRQKAIFMALSAKLKDKKIVVVNDLTFNNIKTKKAVEFLKKMPIEEGSILLVLSGSQPKISISFRNLPYTKVTSAGSLNTLDILKYDWLIFTKSAVGEIGKIFSKKENKVEETPEKKPAVKKPEQVTKKVSDKKLVKKSSKSKVK